MRIENIQDVRILVETARHGSLSAASRVLGITPAAASATLKRLEAQLSTRLFERSTRAMRLTTQGEVLLDYAARALDLLEEGDAQLLTEGEALSGVIRLAAPSDLARSLVLPMLDKFMAEHCNVQLSISVSDRVQDVMRDAVDIALRYGALNDSQLVARQLCMTRRVACASPDYVKRFGAPDSPQDLANHNCLTFQVAGRPYARWQFFRDGHASEIHVRGNRSADDAAIAHQWALAGVGIVYKAELDLTHDLRSGALIKLLPDWHGEPYVLNAILPSNRFVPARVRALVEFLVKAFG
jgi:DNA-binding transcriptional LysR family regulator